jgi:hypothetical protein
MSSEPLTTTPAAADELTADTAEKGLLIAVLLIVLLGLAGMLLMS